MPGAEDAIAELEERLRRFPTRRYPVQHATTQFHLGVTLADAGHLDRAETALATAAAIFDPRALPAEHGKALNALGAVLRLAGRRPEAIEVLTRAAAALAASRSVAEEGAARFNLGLVRREAGDPDAAVEEFECARERLTEAGATGAAASAARELGVARFEAGQRDAARHALEDAIALAGAGGDEAGVGMAANVLGLVELADERGAEAIEAFAAAVAAHPRSVRPHDYAMAKANLALAHEQTSEALAARVAARQALGVRGIPEPVRLQATEILVRLCGPDAASLPGTAGAEAVALLSELPPARRSAIVREELARWLDADDDELADVSAGWIGGQLDRAALAPDLAAELTGGLLELPAPALARVVRGFVRALADRPVAAQDAFRAQMAMGAARFHVPQLLRLRDAFNAVAADEGQPTTWR